jgi:hypothetical protein
MKLIKSLQLSTVCPKATKCGEKVIRSMTKIWVNSKSINISFNTLRVSDSIKGSGERESNGKDDKEVCYKRLPGKHERKRENRRSVCRLQKNLK